MFMMFYAFCNGIGSGICYFIPLVCAWEFFPHKKGTLTGVMISAYGFGSFVFAQVSRAIVNPNGVNPTISDPKEHITYFGPEVANRTP